jgi:hypothetical protein
MLDRGFKGLRSSEISRNKTYIRIVTVIVGLMGNDRVIKENARRQK